MLGHVGEDVEIASGELHGSQFVTAIEAGAAASLLSIGQRRTREEIATVIREGTGRMPGFPDMGGRNIADLVDFLLTGNNGLYVQSLILSSNEFFIKSGNNPLGFLNRLFVVTLGRQVTMQERALLFPQLNLNGRLWFTQAYLAQTQGGWANAALQAAAWGYPVTVVPAVWW